MMKSDNSPRFTLYGLSPKICGTVKKACNFLVDNGIPYQFHDYRADGLEAATLQGFIDKLGWQALLNTRGTTWRKLDEAQRSIINDAKSACALMLAQPAIIKRPLLCATDGSMLAGFDQQAWQLFIQERIS